MRFGILHRTVSYVGLRQISCDVTLLAKKAPLAKGPLTAPTSWSGKAVSEKQVERERKNRFHGDKKGIFDKKLIVLICAIGVVTYISTPIFAASTGRSGSTNFGVVNSQITQAREQYKLGISEDELLKQRIEEKAARSNTEGELKWQKRQEKLRGFGDTLTREEEALGRALDSKEEDPRTLAEIKAEVAKKSADTETWKRLQDEIEEGKARA